MNLKAERKIYKQEYSEDHVLVEHVKCIGKRITEDAELLMSDPKTTREIKIEARIKPQTDATTVTYTIVKYADPRIKKGGKDACTD